MTNKIKAGIDGGAGYTAGELIRILNNHPGAEIAYVNSLSHNGLPITSIHKDLYGETDLHFTNIDFKNVDLVFLCKGHGWSEKFMKETFLPEHIRIIDLSQDFRDGHDRFVYGLPELNRNRIIKSTRVANPGCFATSIQLALLPLAANSLLKDEVHITAITGSTGAGQAQSDTSHFSWRNNNLSVYKPFRHQHIKEIEMTLRNVQATYQASINMIPVRGNFSRGIMSSMYTTSHLQPDVLREIYVRFYESHPFVHIFSEIPDLKQVVNTNKAILYLERINDKIYIISLIDNLIKGASGQAVQNMNLMFGLDESMGLNLKSIGY